jgi:hypothetical protein
VRFISDLLLRYLFAVISIALYGTLIFASGVDEVIPRMAMSIFHAGSVMLFILVVYVPVCWLMFWVISVWYKPAWLELGLSLLIPLMAFVVLPAIYEHFYPPNYDVWGAGSNDEYVQKYADRRELMRYIDYLGSTVTVVMIAFFMQMFRSREDANKFLM